MYLLYIQVQMQDWKYFDNAKNFICSDPLAIVKSITFYLWHNCWDMYHINFEWLRKPLEQTMLETDRTSDSGYRPMTNDDVKPWWKWFIRLSYFVYKFHEYQLIQSQWLSMNTLKTTQRPFFASSSSFLGTPTKWGTVTALILRNACRTFVSGHKAWVE